MICRPKRKRPTRATEPPAPRVKLMDSTGRKVAEIEVQLPFIKECLRLARVKPFPLPFSLSLPSMQDTRLFYVDAANPGKCIRNRVMVARELSLEGIERVCIGCGKPTEDYLAVYYIDSKPQAMMACEACKRSQTDAAAHGEEGPQS